MNNVDNKSNMVVCGEKRIKELEKAIKIALNKIDIEIERGNMTPRYEYYEALKKVVGIPYEFK